MSLPSTANNDVTTIHFLPCCCHIDSPGMCIPALKVLGGLGVAADAVVDGATKRGKVRTF